MMIRGLAAAAAPLALLCAAPAAAADKQDFTRCDGFKMPSGSNDGLSTPPQGEFSVPPGSSMTQKELGEPKLAACTAALADTHLLPAFTLRRVHLLRARALANLQVGDPNAALSDLDEAEKAAAPLAVDPLYRRSLGLSLEMVRAAAWQIKGDRDQVHRLTADIVATRPYSVAVQSIAAALVRSADARGGAAANAGAYLKLLPLMPRARMMQFEADIDAGQFADAARLYPLLKTAYPHAPAAFAFTQDALLLQNELVQNLAADWNAAYVFAALGDIARSNAIEADARAKLAAALAPSPSKKPDMVPQVSPLAQPLNNAVARLATMVQARRAIAERHPADALKTLVGTELPPNTLSIELLTALKSALPPAQAALAPDPAAMAAKVEANRKEAQLNVTALTAAMPAPETRLAKYGGSVGGFIGGFFSLSPDGFKSRTDEATGVTTVEFVGQSTSAPVVEEMTLLRAADLARQQNKGGLVIVDRHDYRRTTTIVYGYGGRGPAMPSGYKTELEVRFVDPAALPSDLAGDRDRVLDANAVYAALAPIYITAPATVKR